MNIHLHSISFKKYSSILIYTFFFIAVVLGSMEIYFERLYGDLTRIGNFPERYFGFQSLQPSISNDLLKDYSLDQADILVIGDSFSAARIWQTKLVADGLKVGTMTWGELKEKEALPSDLGKTLRMSGFKGRYVIIESVERLFEGRMRALAKTPSHQISKTPFVVDTNFALYPFTSRVRVSWSKLNGGAWGVTALYNSIKLFLNLPESYLKSGAVQAIHFDGCQVFSHRLCNYGLFVDGDFNKHTFNSIGNVLDVNRNLKAIGIQPIWMIIPDKATVYLGYGKFNQYPYQNIWQLFAQYPELIAPDLGAEFTNQSRMIKDFYYPNDTHLSVNGALYMGSIMENIMRNIMANKPK
jgi:hypothetical protein